LFIHPVTLKHSKKMSERTKAELLGSIRDPCPRAQKQRGSSLPHPGAPIRSKPTHEKQYDEDDQDEADDTHAAMTEAIAVPTEAATEATKQENDEYDYQYESERHNSIPCLQQLAEHCASLHTPIVWLFLPYCLHHGKGILPAFVSSSATL